VTDLAGVVQGQAVIKLGPDAGSLTDYSCWFRDFTILPIRNTIIKSPTFSSPAIEEKAAANQASVTATFLAVPDVVSGLWWELNRAMGTRTAELFFEWRGDSAAVSSSNPKRTGYIVITGLDSGAPAYQPRLQSKVFPARDVSEPLAA
jgi:hypothetical protein